MTPLFGLFAFLAMTLGGAADQAKVKLPPGFHIELYA